MSPSDDVLDVAEAPPDLAIVLNAEHERFVWLPLDEAFAKCLPHVVASGVANAAAWTELCGAAS
jgi:hypothetical protein